MKLKAGIMGAASALLATWATASAAPSPSPVVAAIIAEERAFTTDVQERDSQLAFRGRVAPDAVGFRPNPETGDLEIGNASAFMHARPRKAGTADVVWWTYLRRSGPIRGPGVLHRPSDL